MNAGSQVERATKITTTRRRIFLPALILTFTLMAVMQWVSGPLSNPAAPLGIVSYELAGTVSRSQEILDSWDEAAKIRAGFSLGIDYLFMLAYALTIGLACLWAGESLRRLGWPLAKIGLILAWGVALAAVLDAIENFGLTLILFNLALAPWPQIAALCATLKFSLIGLALLYVAYAGLAWVAQRPKEQVTLPPSTGPRQQP